ncbi:MAG: CBS domain-containing protein [Elusimicrobia bacterium]|nr:CBS domain-containing protein [Elusimicrobiota bacterium]
MSAKTQALREPIKHIDLLAPVVVDEQTPYSEVLAQMRRQARGSVVICKGQNVTGVFTERDYLYKHCLERVDPKTPIGEIMSSHPVTVTSKTTLGEAVELMHDKKFRNLPIVDDRGRPVGLLTVGRIIRYLAENFPREVVNLPPTMQVSDETDGA